MDPKVPGKIKKLEEVVINRIAAGEVIQRPGNALKELLENSLDAGASNIGVVVKSGGMKLLQIQDDGSGIRKEDLSIVCERFTTSKLEKFEDLQTIGTYGFRGEALASVSHVAHLTIITKTADSQCAYRAEYSDGKLKEYPGQSVQNPKPCAGNQGTLITVEDLFYNMDTRRKALKSVAEEHNKIAEVVSKYAVHNANVGFSLKKFGEPTAELRTPSKSTALDNIKILFGTAIARELMELKCEDKATGFTLQGYISNVNYSTKKLTFLLFINHRLVDSSALKKSIEALYYNYLPKGSHPFIYFGINIDPRNVDVNVHPTKHEVHFLHEDRITTAITNAAENVLLGSNHSRTFMVQSLLPGASFTTSDTTTASSSKKLKKDGDNTIYSSQLSQSQQSSTTIPPKKLVRTDPKVQKLDKFLSSTPDPNLSNLKSFNDSPSRLVALDDNSSAVVAMDYEKETSLAQSNGVEITTTTGSVPGPSGAAPPRREIKLRSVKNLREGILKDTSDTLGETFKNHTFVGCVDRSLALVQHEMNLYLCNTFRLSAELFYQKLVENFGNFGKIHIEEPITIRELVLVAIESGEPYDQHKSPEESAEEIQKFLITKSKMLEDYFGLSFDDKGTLVSIPMILANYIPSMEGIPSYIMNLARKVKWDEEQPCFQTFCFQTALFYAVQPGSSRENDDVGLNGHTWKWTIEHVVYSDIKKVLRPPKQFAQDSTVVLLTSLPELYKVFERC